MKKKRGTKDTLTIKGFARVQLKENGEVVADTGWLQNQVVNLGFQDYLCALLGATTGSKQIARVALGSGSTPAAGDTALSGEFNTATYSRTTPGVSITSSKTLNFSGSFASAASHITASTTLGNIGLLNATATDGTIFSGVGFATSQWNTNQDLNYTYQIQFS